MCGCLLGRAADRAGGGDPGGDVANPDSQGEAYWLGQLTAGESRSAVAFGFTGSLERERQRITDDYMHYLGRQADEQGLNYWTNQFANGQTNEDLITGFLASDEYFQTHSG